MTDLRPLRARMADRIPLRPALSMLVGVVWLLDVGGRLYARIVRCRPTRATRGPAGG